MVEAQPIEIQFQPDQGFLAMATKACARRLRMSTGSVPLDVLVGSVAGGLMIVLSFAMTMLTYKLIGIDYSRGGAFFSYGLFLVLLIVALRWLAMRSVAKRFSSAVYRGAHRMTFQPSGMRLTSDLLDWRLDWRAVDEVVRFHSGFGLRVGALIFAAPDDALPSSLSVDELTRRIDAWREAAQ